MVLSPLLRLESLSVNFPSGNGLLQAVRDVDLSLAPAVITGLVGESGCGKSLTCRAIMRLTPESAVVGGRVLFEGQDLLSMPEARLRKIRGARIGMIFQEPMTALNPVLKVGQQTAEPLRLHLHMSRGEAREKVIELFTRVGIPAAASRIDDYPHQLSGGMRQRIMIAMALSCQPALLLADEPTTALDATIQGQILRLIRSESLERRMAVLLVTHDLGVVADIAEYVGVMYAGTLVEYAGVSQLFGNPLHPYTMGLIAASPGLDSINLKRLAPIPGHVPDLAHMPSGCPFQPRCSRALPVCAKEVPPETRKEAHRVSCWLYV